jgi:hypothetical protein
MAHRRLRKHLKRVLLAAPVIASIGCGGPIGPVVGRCGGPPFSKTVALTDAGLLPDGGIDCELGCECFAASCQPVAGNGLFCLCHPDCTGRRPGDLLGCDHSPARHPVGALFAQAYRLEAASVRAFQHLARELTAHRAPQSLVQRALTSAEQEVRHARVTASLARRFGAHPIRPQYRGGLSVRSLDAVAKENACEGCVRETFGALIGAWQAKHAQDRQVRDGMRSIARDELGHAELAWEVAAWCEPKLSASRRRALREAREATMEALHRECRAEPTAECVRLAGLPSAGTAAALARGLSRFVATA